MTETVLLVNYWRSPLWLQVTASALLSKLDQGFEVEVLDVSSSHFPDQLPYPRAGKASSEKGIDVADFFRNLGANYKEISRKELSRSFKSSEWKAHGELFDRSVLSNVYSFFRNDKPEPGSLLVRLFRNKTAQYAAGAYSAVSAHLLRESYRSIIIPNGRLASQALISAAAKDANVAIEYLEVSDIVPGKYFLRDYSPHDRFRVQAEMSRFFQSEYSLEYRASYNQWSKAWASPTASSNPFTSLWVDGEFKPKHSERTGRIKLAIFTSSQDELWSLGPQWEGHTWEDQYDAFDAYLSRFGERLSAVLRVHPNLANKHPRMTKREVQRIAWLANRHPDLEIVDHLSSQSSYEILSWSDAVLVSSSTIGLEAVGSGRPVINSFASYYDLFCETNSFLSPVEAPRISQLKPALQEKAWAWVAFHELDPDITVLSSEVQPVFAGRRLLPYLRSIVTTASSLSMASNVYFAIVRKANLARKGRMPWDALRRP